MLWIKRNLFLAVGGAVAVALLVAGIFYALGAVSRNASLNEELEQNTATLNRLYGQDPFPATTNVDAARRETERVRSAIGRMRKYFAAPPVEKVSDFAFRTYRDNLLAELRRTASRVGTEIPGSSYAFSFEEQRTRVDFDPRTFPVVPEQMADVRAICNVLFDAHVNPLVNIRRARASADDERSSNQSDYHQLTAMTNTVASAIISPYEVCFQSLSAELALVLQKLAVSPYGMILKAVQVEPVEEPGAGPGTGPGGRVPGIGTRRPPPATRAPADRALTILNERRFQVSMLIYVVRSVEAPKAR